MNIHPIRTDSDHEAALREIEALWGAEDGTDAGDRLDVLVALVDAYEGRHWPITPPFHLYGPDGPKRRDIPAKYYGLIEGGITLFAVLAFAGWQLWSLREKPGDKADKDDGAGG